MADVTGPSSCKRALRAEARRRRRVLTDKDARSRRICRRVAALGEYAAARTVLFYVDAEDEVRTRPLLEEALATGKRVVVPYCDADRLAILRLAELSELAEGRFGILEPRGEFRGLSERQVEVGQVELVLVPGVAFDVRGHRLGQGAGYYDQFLPTLPQSTLRVGLAFACQVFDEIPIDPHDVPMDLVITEEAVYRRPGSTQ